MFATQTNWEGDLCNADIFFFFATQTFVQTQTLIFCNADICSTQTNSQQKLPTDLFNADKRDFCNADIFATLTNLQGEKATR